MNDVFDEKLSEKENWQRDGWLIEETFKSGSTPSP